MKISKKETPQKLLRKYTELSLTEYNRWALEELNLKAGYKELEKYFTTDESRLTKPITSVRKNLNAL